MEILEQLKTPTDGETIARFVAHKLQMPVAFMQEDEPDPDIPTTAECGIYKVKGSPTLTQLTTVLMEIPRTSIWVCPPPTEPLPAPVRPISAPTREDCEELNDIADRFRQLLKTPIGDLALLTKSEAELEAYLQNIIQTHPVFRQLDALLSESAFLEEVLTAFNEALDENNAKRIAWILKPEALDGLEERGYRFLKAFILSQEVALQIWLI